MHAAIDRDFWFALLAARDGHISWDVALAAIRDHRGQNIRSLVEAIGANSHLNESATREIYAAVDAYLTQQQESLEHESTILQDIDTLAARDESSLPLFADATVMSGDGRAAGEADTCRYARVRPLAKGGLGQVFVAQDLELGREVALKEMKEKIASDEFCRQRFTVEAEITGALEHPGVVPVYGFGVYPDGRPYYAMRLIRGESMHKAIKHLHARRENESSADEQAKHVELRKLLARFVSVCHAVNFAHSRGVLHRDIKPENVMLGPYGETLVVDWGLAKVIGTASMREAVEVETTVRPPSGSDSSPTQVGTAVGTPAFMSPEQAMGWHDSLTPASDVFSLGTTLYTLLTGRPPFRGKNVEEVLRNVQLSEYEHPRSINSKIAAPLAAICEKAMENRPSNRYASAGDLAADVESFLADAPVTAYKEPWHARLGRWTRRHKTAVSSMAAAASVLIVSLAAGVFFLAQTNQRESALRTKAEQQRDRANEFYQLAHDAVEDLFIKIDDDPNMKARGLQPLRRELLQSANRFYTQLAQDTGGDEQLAVDRAWALFRAADIEDEIGTTTKSLAQYERALAAFDELLKKDPANVEARDAKALIHVNLSNLLYEQGDTAAADEHLSQSIALFEKLAAEHPKQSHFHRQVAQVLHNRGVRQLQQGQYDRAREAIQNAINANEALLSDRSRPANVLNALVNAFTNLATVQQETGALSEARQTGLKAIEYAQELDKQQDEYPYHQRALAFAESSYAATLLRQQDFAEAEKFYESARLRLEKLAKVHPSVTAFRSLLAEVCYELGILKSEHGDSAEAERLYSRAKDLLSVLTEQDANSMAHRDQLASVLVNLTTLKMSQNKFDEASEHLQQAMNLRDELAKKYPTNTELIRSRANLMVQQSQLHWSQGKNAVAVDQAKQAVVAMQQFPDQMLQNPYVQRDIGVGWQHLGKLHWNEDETEEAVNAYESAEIIQRELATAHPAVATFAVDLGNTKLNLGFIMSADGQSEAAVEHFEVAAEQGESVLEIHPQHAAAHTLVAFAQGALADELFNLQRFAEAAPHYKRAAETNVGAASLVHVTYQALCLAYSEDIESALEIFERLAASVPASGDSLPAYYDVAALASGLSAILKSMESLDDEVKTPAVARLQAISIDLLQKLSAVGYFKDSAHRQRLEEDVRIGPIREHPKVRALLEAPKGEESNG